MIQQILDGLIKLLGPLATLSKDKRDLKDTALRAISNALDETFLYYRDIENGSPRNKERESLLVKYWSAAAIPIRHLDLKLSRICEDKSEYWLNPEKYKVEDINKLGIGLEEVRKAYRNILLPVKKKK